ncbi:hypothetical protein GJAV_G00144450 [Gymnothorax javanicus]|nr:hypothetical protein GJAV_G00144450 [Gymnothorax javanicus]
MKPDGVDTAEPMEMLGAEPVEEALPPEEEQQLQPAAQPSQQDEAAEQQQTEQPEMQMAPPALKEGNAKPADPKAKTKAPAKPKPTTTAARPTGASGPGARPGMTQNRILNGVTKPLSNGVAKKTNTTNAVTAERKKPATTTAPSKKPVGPAAALSARPPAKVPDRKPIGVSRPTTAPATATSGTRTATGVATANKRAPAAPSNDVKPKPKTNAPRPASAAASKASSATPTKSDRPTAPKTTRSAGVPPAPRTAPTATAAKTTAPSARPATSRAGATAPSAGRTATVQPSKPAAPVKKDVSKPTMAPARKPVTAPARPLAAKPSKPEPPKAATATARPEPKKPAAGAKSATDGAKPSRPKPLDGKPPPMAEVKASPRAGAGPRPGLTKAATPSPKRPVGGSTPLATKRGTKPTQSVQPLSASGEPAKKTQSPRSSSRSAAAVTAAAVATAATVAGVAATVPAPVEPQAEPEVAQPSEPVPGVQDSEAVGLPAQQPEPQEEIPAAIVAPLSPAAISAPLSPPLSSNAPEPEDLPFASPMAPQSLVMDEPEQEAECRPEVDEGQELLVPVAAVAPVNQGSEPEATVSIPSDIDATAAAGRQVAEGEEAAEKVDEGIELYEEERRAMEQEVGQLGPVSDMSGKKAVEESQLGFGGCGDLLDFGEVSSSQQGMSEWSKPAVLEDTGVTDNLGETTQKGAAFGSPDVERVSDVATNEEVNDFDDEDQVYDMEMGSERAEDRHRMRQEDEEDEDVEMASEGVTESGLESYGNPDEDDFTEDDRPDNLNYAQPPPEPPMPHAAPWSPSNPFAEPFSQPAADQPGGSSDPWLAGPQTLTQSPAQAWLELSTPAFVSQPEDPAEQEPPPPVSAPLSGTELAAERRSDSSTPEELRQYGGGSDENPDRDWSESAKPEADRDHPVRSAPAADEEDEEEAEAETLPADELLPGGPAPGPESATSTPSTSGDEASDTEGEMQLGEEPDTRGIDNMAFEGNLPSLVEREEEEGGGGRTPPSANSASAASYGFDSNASASNSNAHSTAESCSKSPGIFSLENEEPLPEEAKELISLDPEEEPPNPEEQLYMLCGKPGAEPDHSSLGGAPPLEPLPPSATVAEDDPDGQAPYYSAICEKTDNVLSGRCEGDASPLRRKRPLPLPCDHVSQPRLAAADLPWGLAHTPPSAQLRRLQQHQQQLLQLQQSRERRQLVEGEGAEEEQAEEEGKPSPPEEAVEEEGMGSRFEQEENEPASRREEEEREEEEEQRQRQEQQRQLEQQRRDLLQLQLQLQQQRSLQAEEQKRRRQIQLWQQELEQQQAKPPSSTLLSPSSGLCTIYEAMESIDEEEEEEEELVKEGEREQEDEETEERGEDSPSRTIPDALDSPRRSEREQHQGSVPGQTPLDPPSPGTLPRPPLDLDWSKKVDIVQQLINETLLLTGDGCQPLLLLPGGGRRYPEPTGEQPVAHSTAPPHPTICNGHLGQQLLSGGPGQLAPGGVDSGGAGDPPLKHCSAPFGNPTHYMQRWHIRWAIPAAPTCRKYTTDNSDVHGTHLSCGGQASGSGASPEEARVRAISGILAEESVTTQPVRKLGEICCFTDESLCVTLKYFLEEAVRCLRAWTDDGIPRLLRGGFVACDLGIGVRRRCDIRMRERGRSLVLPLTLASTDCYHRIKRPANFQNAKETLVGEIRAPCVFQAVSLDVQLRAG